MRKELEAWIFRMRTCYNCQREEMTCQKHFFEFIDIHKKAKPTFLEKYNLTDMITERSSD